MTEASAAGPGQQGAKHYRVLIGLVLGIGLGVLANRVFGPEHALLKLIITNVAEPLGKVWLNLLIMMVVPLVFCSLALGVAGIGNLGHLGRIGSRALTYFAGVTALAALLGIGLVNLVGPGEALPTETRDRLLLEYSGKAGEYKAKAEAAAFGIQTFVNIVPRNPLRAMAGSEASNGNPDMLGVIFFALMVGVALTLIPKEKGAALTSLLEAVGEVALVVIRIAMKLAPLGVFGLIFAVTARFGYELLQSLALYVVTVIVGLSLHQFVVFGILIALLVRQNPLEYFRRIGPLMLTAFSTSSSNATLPTTMLVARERLGVPQKILGFVLPLGATMNMNGTALFEGVTVLFLAQVFGVDLSIGQQLIVILMSVITAIGAAGVPSGSIPLLVMVLQMVHIPPEGIGLILGVDRLLDMCRTVVNVSGDIVCASYIARVEEAATANRP